MMELGICLICGEDALYRAFTSSQRLSWDRVKSGVRLIQQNDMQFGDDMVLDEEGLLCAIPL